MEVCLRFLQSRLPCLSAVPASLLCTCLSLSLPRTGSLRGRRPWLTSVHHVACLSLLCRPLPYFPWVVSPAHFSFLWDFLPLLLPRARCVSHHCVSGRGLPRCGQGTTSSGCFGETCCPHATWPRCWVTVVVFLGAGQGSGSLWSLSRPTLPVSAVDRGPSVRSPLEPSRGWRMAAARGREVRGWEQGPLLLSSGSFSLSLPHFPREGRRTWRGRSWG